MDIFLNFIVDELLAESGLQENQSINKSVDNCILWRPAYHSTSQPPAQIIHQQ
jgi:hypothetical protein